MRLGDIRQYRVTIDNYDVTDAVIGSKIFQDVTSPTWSAQIFFMDSADLLSTLPIKSGSKIKILLETKHGVPTDMKHEFEFYVYRVGDKQMQNQKTLTYTVYAATNEFVFNLTNRISRNFKNTKMTDCIRQVVGDCFPGMTVEGSSCDNNANLIIPNWTPFNAIGWMLKMAHSANNADYLFFQSDDKKFMLDTITNCFNKLGGQATLRVKPANVGTDPLDVYNMIKYYFQHADASTNLSSGYYGNTLKTFDFRTKEWNVKTYKTKETKTWTDTFDNAENSMVSFKAKAKNILQNGNSPADDADVWLQSRMASLQNLEQEKLLAQISGTVGCYTWIGQTINVDLPNQSALTNEGTDSKRKGRYLVTAIAHSINRQTYTCDLELVKRSVN